MNQEGTLLSIARVLAVVKGQIPDGGGQVLNEALAEAAEEALNAIVAGTPVEGLVRARLTIHRSFNGSWIIDASLNLWTGVSWAFGVLETASKLPKIVEGLTSLESQIAKLFARKASIVMPDVTTSVAVVPPTLKQAHQLGIPGQDWCNELSSHLGAHVVIGLRGNHAYLSGVLVSCDPGFVRLKQGRNTTVAATAELLAFKACPVDV